MAKEMHTGEREGDSGAQSYQRDVQACKEIFVTWPWVTGIIVGSVIVLLGAAWAGSAAWTNINSQVAEVGQQVNQIVAVSYKDVDTLKKQQKAIIDLLKKQKP
jgi:hypothetical protein